MHSARRSLKYFLGLAAGAFFGDYRDVLRGDVGSTGLRTTIGCSWRHATIAPFRPAN